MGKIYGVLVFLMLFFVPIVFVPMNMLYIILLQEDKTHAVPAEIGTTSKPITVINKDTEVVVEQIITTVSTDSLVEMRVL